MATEASPTTPLLTVSGLKTHFIEKRKTIRGVEGATYELYPGRTLAVVGESGSGKSVTALSILRLLPSHAKIVEGSIVFDGMDLTRLDERAMREIRGKRIAMIFQEPMTSLNPVHTIGRQIMEPLLVHTDATKAKARARARDLLAEVGISDPERRLNDYPFQLSGGMRQRVMIAIALACDPEILIADEPTSALDVTIQLQLIRLIQKIQKERGMSVVLITHDLGIVAEMADDIAVMYAGRTMEFGSAQDIFESGRHPYLEGLKGCVPRLDIEQDVLPVIPGNVPDAGAFPSGCAFHPRCPYATERCRTEEPPTFALSGRHRAKCWLCEETER